MKQKYTIIKDPSKDALVIQEHAELDKESMSLLCEQSYPKETIQAAIRGGRGSVISAIRTLNLYPPLPYAQRMAQAVIDLYGADAPEGSTDLVFDDMEALLREPELADDLDDVEDESDDIDELLDEDDLEDEFDDDDKIDPVNSPLKVADDDSIEVDDDA